MRFELTILGSSGAVPFKNRYMTAHVLNVREQLFLIDCGEGTQMRMQQYAIKRGKINHIFISHLHGDHVFGLPGILTSFGLNHRTTPLHIYSPKGLKGMMDGLFPYESKSPPFDIIYHETDTEVYRKIFENNDLEVYTIPLDHGIPCNGYLFREKPLARNMKKDKIEEYQIPFQDIRAIKSGEDWKDAQGNIISNLELTTDAAATRSYAFCSDTSYKKDIVPYISEVDLLYHEATFLHADLEKAIATNHTTAYQAALIAQEAKVKRLVMGHYSARYDRTDAHLEEAKSIFNESYLGYDGAVFTIASKK